MTEAKSNDTSTGPEEPVEVSWRDIRPAPKREPKKPAKIRKLWRFRYSFEFASDGLWCITQSSGARFTFPLAVGWMEEPARLVPKGEPPLHAVVFFLGPVALDVGFL